jgi:hypothetical protein
MSLTRDAECKPVEHWGNAITKNRPLGRGLENSNCCKKWMPYPRRIRTVVNSFLGARYTCKWITSGLPVTRPERAMRDPPSQSAEPPCRSGFRAPKKAASPWDAACHLQTRWLYRLTIFCKRGSVHSPANSWSE